MAVDTSRALKAADIPFVRQNRENALAHFGGRGHHGGFAAHRCVADPREHIADRIIHFKSPLPAGFHEARSQAALAQLPQRDTRYFELAVIPVWATGQLAAVVQTGCTAIAGQFSQREGSAETLFHRLALVVDDLLERGALFGELIDQILALLLALDH